MRTNDKQTCVERPAAIAGTYRNRVAFALSKGSRPDRRSAAVDFAGLAALLADARRAAHESRAADATAALAAYRAKAKAALGSYP